jgi:hypothetical protein
VNVLLAAFAYENIGDCMLDNKHENCLADIPVCCWTEIKNIYVVKITIILVRVTSCTRKASSNQSLLVLTGIDL